MVNSYNLLCPGFDKCNDNNTVYRELFAKENFRDMSIVSVHKKTFTNLVI